MKQQIFSIFTRTPLHIGAGSSVGIVDLPVIRERHTSYPVIPGSALKGVLADLFLADCEAKGLRKGGSDAEMLFGKNNDPRNAAAGKLLIGESRVLAFPVRSAKAGFAWVTCPLALGRYLRDAGKSIQLPELKETECLAVQGLEFDKASIVLEEYRLDCKGDAEGVLAKIASEFVKLSEDTLWKDELAKHLVVLSDEMFQYFVENTCEVAQHVKIDDETGTAQKGGLFCQENVPAETMFYTVLHESGADALAILQEKLAGVGNLLQIGADATTGLGWCTVTLLANGQN